MSFQKIYNDPVYGFVALTSRNLFELVEHPWFQRLRRIQQLGLGSLVYPGAIHTRFQHALGAMHLMNKAIAVLRSKGHHISEQEAEAAAAAILLHDIGHGPFSHALEKTLVPGFHHEGLSLAFMKALEQSFSGEKAGMLNMAEQIFSGRHPKRFLHELVNSQLDVDRLDYLTRDTYFTGVHEGAIGTNRIIDMLDLDDEGGLVVEAKGIYSIEKFIVARRIMYWQVYLHKTVLCAEQMLIRTLSRARDLFQNGASIYTTPALEKMLLLSGEGPRVADAGFLEAYAQLDDSDIWVALKAWAQDQDRVLSLLAGGIVQRRLFRVVMKKEAFAPDLKQKLVERIADQFELSKSDAADLLVQDKTENSAYNPRDKSIRIRYKDGAVQDLALASDQLNLQFMSDPVVKHYICFPKNLVVDFQV